MEGDAKALIQIAALVVASMTYARFVSSSIAPSKLRLVALLPVLVLLPFLPCRLSSIHLRSIAFFLLVWLAVFKLLFLSFGLGPLSPSLPLPTFLVVSFLPVTLRSSNSPPYIPFLRLFVHSLIKSILLSLLIELYQFKSRLHLYLLISIYCAHIYLSLDLLLSCSALLVRVLLHLDVEPHFDAPYKSSSLQDFWGRRWNLMVTGLLRTSVYHPVSVRWGPDVGILAAFLVSGFIHELMFWYLTFVGPTGEVTCFFVVNGLCTVVEGVGKRKGWWRPHPLVATPLVVGFVVVTGNWLLLPPLLRSGCDRVVQEESRVAMRFLGDAATAVVSRIGLVPWQ